MGRPYIPRGPIPWYWPLGAGGAFIVGGFILLGQVRSGDGGFQEWQVAWDTGVRTNAVVVARRSQSHHIRIDYEFVADGRTFRANNRRVHGNAAQYGATIEVAYDPSDPQRSVCQEERPDYRRDDGSGGFKWGAASMFLVGAVGLIAGVAAWAKR